MSVALALAEVRLGVGGTGWRGGRGKRKDFEFLRDHVESLECVVGLKFEFREMQRAESGVIVLNSRRVFG